MKINGTTIGSVGASDASGKLKPATQSARKAAASSSGDQVELSSLSARLQEASAALAETPVIDTARVAEIKQAITEGRFQVHPERVADGLIDSVRQMLARQG